MKCPDFKSIKPGWKVDSSEIGKWRKFFLLSGIALGDSIV